ncbi:Tetratricopeptide repeat (TPR)-like superfamily protein [Zea mays]|uniref:Tetratricopeptide repeat (TPR)-like superfamily protein n=1 Tax=Zea mays TaxID=4577 RepID=A0A1D6KRE9_MAIZE|nr:Tetratricopeptide repeat (TPR)-like superfamily protein [Zea mays]
MDDRRRRDLPHGHRQAERRQRRGLNRAASALGIGDTIQKQTRKRRRRDDLTFTTGKCPGRPAGRPFRWRV